jgi:hypothetical protein
MSVASCAWGSMGSMGNNNGSMGNNGSIGSMAERVQAGYSMVSNDANESVGQGYIHKAKTKTKTLKVSTCERRQVSG